ncbi:Hypp805 [Branchiostoma lanceolatum]|uniref:Hypp805 protein n=2 Tax=Branchiostoma lanceolatum TaxID=7740 RepID=A0A8J9YQI4_BRALA|nr:Hypp805 [Branchiostoma lanceolatum]
MSIITTTTTMSVVSVVLVTLIVLISIAIIVHSAVGCVSGNCVCCNHSRNHNMVLEITPQRETFELTSVILTQVSMDSTKPNAEVVDHLTGSVDLPGQMHQETDSIKLDSSCPAKYQVENI